MLKEQKSTVFSFFKWMANQYIQLERKTLPYTCKFGGLLQRSGNVFVIVEFSGQLNTIEIELSKLVEENLFEFFCPDDKKKIFSAFYNSDRFKLSGRYYCRERKIEMVVLTEILTGNNMTLPAHMVSDNDKMIELLSRKDVKSVCATSAVEFTRNILINDRQ